MKILDRKNSPLLNREEILLSMEFEGATPKKEELRKKFNGGFWLLKQAGRKRFRALQNLLFSGYLFSIL